MGRILGKSFESQQVNEEESRAQEAQRLESEASPNSLRNFLSGPAITTGQPGRVQAEKNIAGREDALTQLRTTSAKDPDEFLLGGIGKAGAQGLDALNLVGERVSGAVTAPILEAMDPLRKDIGEDTLLALVNGLQGKRKVRMEDLITAKLPEINVAGSDLRKPIALIGGLATELVGGAGIVKSARGILQGGKETLDTVNKSFELAKKIKTSVGDEIGKLFSDPARQQLMQTINSGSLGRVVNSIPKTIQNKIRKNVELYGVLYDDATGAVKNTAENVWKFRKAVDDVISPRTFKEGASNQTQAVLAKARKELAGFLVQADEKIGPLMNKFSEFSSVLDDAGSILTSGGKTVVNKAVTALKAGGEPQKRAALEKFSRTFPKGAEMIQALNVLKRNRAVTNAAVGIAKVGVGGAVLSRFLKPTNQFLSGESNQPTQGGGG